MHYWFKFSDLSTRLMSLFFERRFKKRRQHEFYNFEWWTSVSHKIQCCRIEFFYDFKIRHEFEDYCEMTTRIWWIHNKSSESDRLCSSANEITHRATTFIYNARRLMFFASNAEIYNSWFEFKFCDHSSSRQDHFHNTNWIYQCSIIQNTND
jgi:hypothetical protein